LAKKGFSILMNAYNILRVVLDMRKSERSEAPFVKCEALLKY